MRRRTSPRLVRLLRTGGEFEERSEEGGGGRGANDDSVERSDDDVRCKSDEVYARILSNWRPLVAALQESFGESQCS